MGHSIPAEQNRHITGPPLAIRCAGTGLEPFSGFLAGSERWRAPAAGTSNHDDNRNGVTLYRRNFDLYWLRGEVVDGLAALDIPRIRCYYGSLKKKPRPELFYFGPGQSVLCVSVAQGVQ